MTTYDKFSYSPLGKAFEKQVKSAEQQGKKQVEPIQSLDLATKT